MTTRETKVPALPSVGQDNLTEVVQAIKNGLDIREGRLGDPLDQFVTFRELKALGLVNDSEQTSMGGVGGGGVIPVGPGPTDYNENTDQTTPPGPQGLIATGGYSAIYLSWYGNNYRNHAYTEIWRNDKDELGSAIKIGTTIGNLYSDEVGTERTYFYWVRFVSQANVVGPYNLTSGTKASTALDVVKRLDILREDILNDPFVRELGERLTITETGIQRLDSVTATQAKTVQQVSSVSGSNQAAVQVLSKSVDGLSAQFSVKIDNNGHVSGFGLSSRPIDGTPRSAFIVRADRFAIVGPNDATDPLGTLSPTNVPFTVLTNPTSIDGLTYPAGAWIKTAFIADATITSAKIQSLAADKITAGTITAAVDMRSPTIRSGNISPGTAGFYLGQSGGVNQFYVGNGSTGLSGRSLSFDGTDAIVRGNIFAYGGTIGGITIASTYLQSTNYAADTSGFRFNNTDGSAEFNSIKARGVTIYKNDGTVLLSSGSSIPTSAISGLGAFATLNSITSANISTYIAGAAIGEAYIANAAITSAKIANASVQTLKIAGSAVTVPTYGTSFVDTTNYTSAWSDVLTMTVPISGLDTGESIGLIINGVSSVYPANGTATDIVAGVFINDVLVSEMAASLSGYGFSHAFTGYALVNNGNNIIRIAFKQTLIASKPITILTNATALAGKR